VTAKSRRGLFGALDAPVGATMNLRLYPRIILASAVWCAFSFQAHAATVTISQVTTDYTTVTLPTSSFNPTPFSSTNTSTTVTGQIPNVYRSPFENIGSGGGTLLSDGGYGVGGWANLVYTSIQAGGSATYNFAGPATELSLLWGSPDSYNTLTFYSGLNGTGTDLFSITGSQLNIQTYGHDLVDLNMTGGTFESVVLDSGENAFEFADLQDALLTPLPATLPLFAGGLGLVGFLTGRRKRSAQAIAAP
jgi:hypothetical protein